MRSFIDFVIERREQLGTLFLEHVQLTLLAVFIAVVVGVPVGILIAKSKNLAKPVIGVANVVQAVPSLALLGFLIPFLGIGSKPAIVMVFLYSLLPIIKNTYTGLTNINPDTLEAAEGMGMTKNLILRKIQIPLALPIIMTGIRISAVTAVGLMTIAAFVGAGGLGYMVFSGVQSVNNNMILAGAIPAGLLALLLDFFLGRIEDEVVPNGIKKADGTLKVKNKGFGTLALKATAAVLVLSMVSYGVTSLFADKSNVIRVGSKDFNEQLILGHMVSSLIEEKTDLTVQRDLNLGGTSVAFKAMESDNLDLYVEYTGTILINVLNHTEKTTPEEAYDIVKSRLSEEFGITTTEPIGFNNTYALAVRKDTAEEYGLKTYSDLARESSKLVLSSTIEFTNREDGLLGLQKLYGMDFETVTPLNAGLRYTSLDSKNSDVIDAFSTDGLLVAFDLTVLEDDKGLFPPYYAVPIVRTEIIEKYPELEDVLNLLSGRIDDETMRQLNFKVDEEQQDPRKVAEDYLREVKLID